MNHPITKALVIEIAAHVSERKALKQHMSKVMQDKDIPLNDRWALYNATPAQMLNSESDIMELSCMRNLGIYWRDISDFERYQCVNPVDYMDYVAAKGVSEEAFKEEILMLQLHSFIYDW